MRKYSFLFIFSIATALAVAQETDVARPDWPQPIIKGSVVVWGGDAGKEAAMGAFVRLAGDSEMLVVSNTADTARATWVDVENAKVV
ncbi:MAG: hypothetical protein IH906_08045, partial [Proteobacteria bacterium]|nr:hypothetical protein [Pseudomonadota bacterium]